MIDQDQSLRALLIGAVERWRKNHRPCKHTIADLGARAAYCCEQCLVDHILATLKKARYGLEKR
jgi:hypothetical protein